MKIVLFNPGPQACAYFIVLSRTQAFRILTIFKWFVLLVLTKTDSGWEDILPVSNKNKWLQLHKPIEEQRGIEVVARSPCPSFHLKRRLFTLGGKQMIATRSVLSRSLLRSLLRLSLTACFAHARILSLARSPTHSELQGKTFMSLNWMLRFHIMLTHCAVVLFFLHFGRCYVDPDCAKEQWDWAKKGSQFGCS